MPTWTEDIVAALKMMGGTGTLAEIYAAVGTRRAPLAMSWKDIVRRNIQDHSSDSAGYRGRGDLFFSVDGLGGGVWGLRELVTATPEAVDIAGGSSVPKRALQLTYRVLRDTELARQLKLLHGDQCQLCGLALALSPTKTYSEGHHIIPVGDPHCGPDTPENIIVLCPNHHALCDYGAIRIERSAITERTGHRIAQESLGYHNTHIYGTR